MEKTQSKNKKPFDLLILVEIAICAGIAMVLDFFIPSMSQSIKPNIKMVPIFILAFRRGPAAGLAGGLLWGVLQIVTGEAYMVTFLQTLVDYVFAFTAVGFAGLMHKPLMAELKKDRSEYSLAKAGLYASLGALIGGFARIIFHFISGFWFWSSSAPEGVSPVLFSLTVNALAFLTETGTCMVLLWVMSPYYKQLLIPRNYGHRR